MIPTVIGAGLVAGGLIARRRLVRLGLVSIVVAVLWGLVVFSIDARAETLLGGAGLAWLNAVVGAVLGAALRSLVSATVGRAWVGR